MGDATTPTRYERVKAILDRAAGESEAAYGEAGPSFWRRPLAELLEATVHGVRMIAPEAPPKAACCGGGGRGAASGLVQGLRGEAPFDGSRFPRLPWGGEAVAPEDVLFISDWIDDGCPADDRATSVALDLAPGDDADQGLQAVAGGDASELPVFPGLPHQHASRYPQLRQRMNVDCLGDEQLAALRRAFRRLYALNKWPEDRRNYNNLALIHQSHCQHGWERFLPWHRIYLYELEQGLEDVVPGVTLPYWDWTMAGYRPSCPEKGWRIPKALQAFLTEESIAFLEAAKPSLTKAQGRELRKGIVDPAKTYYSLSGFFADVATLIGKDFTVGAHRRRFIDALLAANSLWYPLRYPGQYNQKGKPSTITDTIHYHYPTADDMEQILSLRTFRDFGGGSLYNDSFGFLDQNPHNTMHIWTGGMNPDYPEASAREKLHQVEKASHVAAGDPGTTRNRAVQVGGRRFHSREDMYQQPQFGDMFSNLTASYDPVFWPIHANIDRNWHLWQERNPHAVPADLTSVLTPWSYTLADTLDMSRFGYEYVRCAYLVPVGLEAPVGRVVSQPIALTEGVRGSVADGGRAEVRLHRIPQLPRSCFIRVFLNQPGADARTPPSGPHYGGYLAIFGHGECYGGPGHCDLPPGRRREHDLRPRSHDTPRNHRVDVTRSARELIEAGATSLQVSLVVIGVDYCEDPELLRLEGVSLNFLS
jgi:tyrosinase